MSLRLLNSLQTRVVSGRHLRNMLQSPSCILSTNDCRRYRSKDAEDDSLDYIQKFYQIHSSESSNGSKEYLLIPPSSTSKDDKVASLHRHRNILFAARSFHPHIGMQELCIPLVDMALKEAGEHGEQPQAIASLVGLSEWIRDSLEKNDCETLTKLQTEDDLAFQAVKAIATGIPREGHSVVGIGTYRDGEEGWKVLAKEYISLQLAEEVNLYEQREARLTEIEHMADQNPGYLQSAGGAMARLFFL